MKTYEKNDVKGAARTFRINYVVTMLILLYITDIVHELSDITHGQFVTMRAIICFAGVILLSRFLTINAVKKYQITKQFKDNLRFNINMVIIIVAVISIFYFLFILNSNVNKVEDSAQYRMAVTFLGEETVEEQLKDVKKEARNGFIIIWVAILAGSAVAIYSEEKILDRYCREDILEVEQEEINS